MNCQMLNAILLLISTKSEGTAIELDPFQDIEFSPRQQW